MHRSLQRNIVTNVFFSFLSNGSNLFRTEMMPTLKELQSQQRIVEWGRLWNIRSDKEKSEYQSRFLEMKRNYEKELALYNQVRLRDVSFPFFYMLYCEYVV